MELGVHADASASVRRGSRVNCIEGIASVGANVSTTAGVTVGGNYGRTGNSETRNSVTGEYGETFEQNRSDSGGARWGRLHEPRPKGGLGAV